ncbi:MAG: hypothetical protein WCD86_20155 [Ktedonobacteraceae bacterium]
MAPYAQAMGAFLAPFFAVNRGVTPPDPQEVADVVAHLIAQPAGRETIPEQGQIERSVEKYLN